MCVCVCVSVSVSVSVYVCVCVCVCVCDRELSYVGGRGSVKLMDGLQVAVNGVQYNTAQDVLQLLCAIDLEPRQHCNSLGTIPFVVHCLFSIHNSSLSISVRNFA